MITDRYHSDKHFSEFLPTSWLQKSTGTKYVTLCIKCGQDQNVSCSSILTGWHCLLALEDECAAAPSTTRWFSSQLVPR